VSGAPAGTVLVTGAFGQVGRRCAEILPGDPDDDRGWSFTGFFDTTESAALLDFQRHDWSQPMAWIAE
jgi:hypothetical protein